MVDLQPVGFAADHAGPVALFPGALPVPFPLALGAAAGCVVHAVTAGAELGGVRVLGPGEVPSVRRRARLSSYGR
jgi:hypothetical protein